MLTVTLTCWPGAIATMRPCTFRRTRSATAWPNERRAVGQDHRELFAAEARHRVHRPDAVVQRLRHRLQHQVAGRVAVGVVDLLEVIDVDHQHQRRLAGPRDAVDLAGQRELELAPVRQAGERVAARELAQPVDHCLQPRRPTPAARSGSTCPTAAAAAARSPVAADLRGPGWGGASAAKAAWQWSIQSSSAVRRHNRSKSGVMSPLFAAGTAPAGR